MITVSVDINPNCVCGQGFSVDHAMNPLQPLTGETLRFTTANRENEARVDVSAAGFWGHKYQKTFFDV